MIKQIRRGIALTILIGMTTINVMAIGNSSDKATIQNSTLNEQPTVETLLLSLEPINLEITRLPQPRPFSGERVIDNFYEDKKLEEEVKTKATAEKVKEVKKTKTTTKKVKNNKVAAPQEQINPLFYELTDEEWEFLYRTARCEAGNLCKTYSECGKCEECAKAKKGQKNVVYVILNRLHNQEFPNTVEEVIFASHQFSVTTSSDFYNVQLTDFLKTNVQEAVKDWKAGESAQGALYFNSHSNDYWSWAVFLFEDEVGHYFFYE